jgi:hypothetical protein
MAISTPATYLEEDFSGASLLAEIRARMRTAGTVMWPAVRERLVRPVRGAKPITHLDIQRAVDAGHLTDRHQEAKDRWSATILGEHPDPICLLAVHCCIEADKRSPVEITGICLVDSRFQFET